MAVRKACPTLYTERLILRPFTLADADDVQRLAGDAAVASTTLNIPHPYEDGLAEQWISTHQEKFDLGIGVTFAVTLRDGDALIGCIGLIMNQRHSRGTLGYWVGKPWWNSGYCTEAALAVLQYGLEELGLHRIVATHFARNPASGRVMQKIGMTHEGCLRQHVKKGEGFEDLEYYAVLRSEYEFA